MSDDRVIARCQRPAAHVAGSSYKPLLLSIITMARCRRLQLRGSSISRSSSIRARQTNRQTTTISCHIVTCWYGRLRNTPAGLLSALSIVSGAQNGQANDRANDGPAVNRQSLIPTRANSTLAHYPVNHRLFRRDVWGHVIHVYVSSNNSATDSNIEWINSEMTGICICGFAHDWFGAETQWADCVVIYCIPLSYFLLIVRCTSDDSSSDDSSPYIAVKHMTSYII